MGSRAVVIVCRNEDAARRRFGIVEEGVGICYTRTGRRFFDDAKIEKEFLEKVRGAVDAAGFWQQFETDWICLDAELMPEGSGTIAAAIRRCGRGCDSVSYRNSRVS